MIESTPPIFDFCILGAGIAGLSLADALQEKGYRVIVLEKNDIASGASGSPGALVNPAAGRRAKKKLESRSLLPSYISKPAEGNGIFK